MLVYLQLNLSGIEIRFGNLKNNLIGCSLQLNLSGIEMVLVLDLLKKIVIAFN